MAKATNKLTALKVQKIKESGWYADGMGLYLQVSQGGSKSWVYRYQKAGKEYRIGLGGLSSISLENARKAAGRHREKRSEGIDPLEHKRVEKAEKSLKDARRTTFKDCALSCIEAHKRGWKNRKHESQWRNTMEAYAFPVLGGLPVQDIDVGLVLKVLEPIWHEKPETATRVRQRIEKILDWAKARKYRTDENPARWRGHLDQLLPKRSKVQKPKHFAAMPYVDLPEYFQALSTLNTTASRALAFTILTATRSSEARKATWDEIDTESGIWNIPAARMKADRDHRVPLSDKAIAILKEAAKVKRDDLVFPGIRKGRPISEAATLNELKKTYPTLTVHGFRSSFRDWCAEMTNYPREVAEAALAHSLKDKTEAAYQRGDMFEKRRKLMESWSKYCLTGNKTADVVPIKKKA